ncbi:MAG: hypothetical protein RBT81_05990 [Gammaproteobacteria bacterium]|jgi:hypothetical protein|nr:hypothetical protein [Gammaproteobacteria bacterium]
MPWMKWLPWRFLIRRVARAHGFLDPVLLLSHLHRFAQPAEVGVPLELLRAGVVFHARGLINSRVIQHNLDWVWPYWVERQFDPGDPSFVPRAFAITHVNLTHRNWTALGVPDLSELAVVDPRGLLTPFADGWSLDCWVIDEDGAQLLPSRAREAVQKLECDDSNCAVVTETRAAGMLLRTRILMEPDGEQAICRLQARAQADGSAWLVLSLRPANPEGVSFVHKATLTADRRAWIIDDKYRVSFDAPADRHHVSDYRAGDVHIHLHDLADDIAIQCGVGMATAAAMFRIDPGRPRDLQVDIPVEVPADERGCARAWTDSLDGHCQLTIPDPVWQGLYDAALRTLIIHSPRDVFPGPYTYKRFWFRDAAFIIYALICAGLTGRAERALDRFPLRQDLTGYFHSQEGEWDSNGQALWIMERFCAFTGTAPKPEWHTAIRRGVQWIGRKRLPAGNEPHAGLMPAGFSAEHLGPNDHYYWDDFWSVGGLRAAARLMDSFDEAGAAGARAEANSFMAAIERALANDRKRVGRPAMPAAPHRRLDAGAIGSLAGGYPLELQAPDDPRLVDTAAFLMERCFYQGGFFQDMIHSGVNAYLTLHVAQVLLRAGDERALALIDRVAALASPTGQWPEAIHPATLGGCMGDGQHVWAAAEWVLMVRNALVREEGDRLIVAAGAAPRWLRPGNRIALGPAPTAFGAISIEILVPREDTITVSWNGDWHRPPAAVEIRLPGTEPQLCDVDAGTVEVRVTEGER